LLLYLLRLLAHADESLDLAGTFVCAAFCGNRVHCPPPLDSGRSCGLLDRAEIRDREGSSRQRVENIHGPSSPRRWGVDLDFAPQRSVPGLILEWRNAGAHPRTSHRTRRFVRTAAQPHLYVTGSAGCVHCGFIGFGLRRHGVSFRSGSSTVGSSRSPSRST
jgi:hypothetical protein